MSFCQREWSPTGSTLSPMILVLRFSNSGMSPAMYPSSVVHTGVKSFGCENRIAQPLPIQSWKLIVPWVVSAVKFGASSLMRNAMVQSPCRTPARGLAGLPRMARRANSHKRRRGPPALRFGGCPTPDANLLEQRLDRAAGKAKRDLVGQPAVADLAFGGGDDDFARQRDARQAGIERHAHVLEAARAAEGPARGRHDRHRLVGQHRLKGRARGPVDRIFQYARDAVVELRGAQHEPVGRRDVGQHLL